jgi:hypothetical protein
MLVDVRTTCRSGWGVGLVCVSVLGGCAPTPNQPGQVSVDAACAAGGTDSGTRITVTIRNGTPSHLSMVVGVVLGSADHLAEAISLRLKRPGDVGVEIYQYSHPRYGVVAGRMDPWRLEVAAGHAASIEVDAQHFLSTTSGRRFSVAEEGELTVGLRDLDSKSWSGNQLGRRWTGMVESPPMRVPESCVQPKGVGSR